MTNKRKTDKKNQPQEPKTKFGKLLHAVLVVLKVKMLIHKMQYFNRPQIRKGKLMKLLCTK